MILTNDKMNFSDLLKQKQWESYEDYSGEISAMVSDDVRKSMEEDIVMMEQIKDSKEFKACEVRDAWERKDEAEDLLLDGKVVGIDGTISKYRFASGYRCQIGVVAVNYQQDTIRRSFYISAATLRQEPEELRDKIERRTSANEELSDYHLRGLMMYREREAGLDPKFGDSYIMYHGQLLPFELRSGLGRLRALETTLDLLKKVVSSRRVMSVVSQNWSHQELWTLGTALEPGQYLTHPTSTVKSHLINNERFLDEPDKWRKDEYELAKDFVNEYAGDIKIGVVKVAYRPYIFYAHKDIFDLAAAIIARDSLFQKQKGFPLLIDYADNLATEYFSNSNYNNMIEWELAKSGGYLREAGERRMRVK